jgi:hypothetical protein
MATNQQSQSAAKHGRRTRPVPPELAELARRALTNRTPREAEKLVGVGRQALISAAAGLEVAAGTIAGLRLAHLERKVK